MEAFQKRDYFPYPNSLDPLTPTFRKGLIPIAVFAILSLFGVTLLLTFITYRLISWRRHYKEYVGYNQYVILIYNLLLADFQQALSFSIELHWLRIGKILAPTAPCFTQAWFLHIGDVSSGFFVLAIAIHTWLGVVRGYKMPYFQFVCCIIGIWLFALLLTLIGPLMHKDRFFTRAGGWCWISTDFEPERLWLHYLWIFIVEFGTVLIYGHVFIHLRGRIRTVASNDTRRLWRATKFMVLYPLCYVILTLPLAAGRMYAMTGKSLPDVYFCVAGALLTSCGWIDALLYCLTRRVLVSSQVTNTPRTVTTTVANAMRPGDMQEYGLKSMNKDNVATARTVTIVGGSNRISRLVDQRSRRSHVKNGHSFNDISETGSMESIIKTSNAINIVTETNIQIESADSLEGDTARESESISSHNESRSQSQSGPLHKETRTEPFLPNVSPG